jgi:hypothetical protein
LFASPSIGKGAEALGKDIDIRIGVVGGGGWGGSAHAVVLDDTLGPSLPAERLVLIVVRVSGGVGVGG